MTAPLSALRALGTRTLEELVRALSAGHLPGGASPFQIQRIVRTADQRAAEELSGLLRSGLSPAHAALLLEIVVAERGTKEIACAPELVTSGPNATGATRDTGVVMRELFATAEERVLVVGFAVYQGHQVFRVLADRMDKRPKMSVRLCLDVSRQPGDTSRASGILERFAARFRDREWPGSRLPEVFYDPRSLAMESGVRASLHAKCVVIDGHAALLGSANLTEAAQQRNIEVGLLVRAPRRGKGPRGALRGAHTGWVSQGPCWAVTPPEQPFDPLYRPPEKIFEIRERAFLAKALESQTTQGGDQNQRSHQPVEKPAEERAETARKGPNATRASHHCNPRNPREIRDYACNP
jgi:phosphatidylserine/phosphatidylglycerophosphate/cardiolipin synthase-like enzyme